MIPYFEWRTVPLGPLTLQVWGFFAAVGVVIGAWFAMHQAKKRGLDVEAFESMAFLVVIASFLGARLFHVLFYEPAFYFAHPLEILSVWNGGLSSFGGFAGAAAAFFLHLRRSKLPLLKTADVLTAALPLGLGCGRIGCFLIHDHPGTLAYGAGKWLAVNYPDGQRYDLGMLLGIFDFLMFGAFLILLRKPRKDGFYFALFMIAYGPVRFLLDFLRVIDVRYFGLTPAQYACLPLFGAGCYLMVRTRTQKGEDGDRKGSAVVLSDTR